MRKNLAICFTLIALTAVPSPPPSNAAARTQERYQHAKEIMNDIIHKKYCSADIDIPPDIAQNMVTSIMDQCDLIENVHSPRRSPDQMMVFIGYSLKKEPDKLRVLYIYRNTPESKSQLVDCTIEHFSTFTHEQYKTKFFYIESTDSDEAQN